MGARIHQTPAIMLAMHFHQNITKGPQQADTGRLVIDMRPRTAILSKASAQDHRFTGLDQDIGLVQQGPGGMGIRQIEFGDGLGFASPGPDLGPVGTLPGRQAKGTQKNGFTGTGFTGQGAESAFESRIKRVDQDDVANGKGEQHPAVRTPARLAEDTPPGAIEIGRVLMLNGIINRRLDC